MTTYYMLDRFGKEMFEVRDEMFYFRSMLYDLFGFQLKFDGLGVLEATYEQSCKLLRKDSEVFLEAVDIYTEIAD